jgi:two-component system, sensor histidine kinase and response regulator
MQRILLVENQLDLQEEICDVLRYEGFETEAVADLQTARAVLDKHRIDLVLCSMLMPDQQGMQLLEHMRAEPRHNSIPFVFLTGVVQIDVLRQAMDAGADDYLLKPIRSKDLINAIRARLKRADALKNVGYEKLQQQRQVLLHHFPHEVFTPLNVSLNVGKIIKKKRHDMAPHDLNQWSDMLIRSNTRLLHLLENQLMYLELHISDMHSEPEPPPLALKTQLEQLAQERSEAYERPDDLELHLEDITYPIRGKHFQIIARALIDNAFKFSEPKTPVVISLQIKNERVYFEVTDTGRGMPRSQIESIQAFQQFNRDQHEQQGLGLGLELCQRLLDVLQGHLHIESIEGRYTHVQVALK